MGETSVIASMSGEVVLSIEDIKEQASKTLPTTARGESSSDIFLWQNYPRAKFFQILVICRS